VEEAKVHPIGATCRLGMLNSVFPATEAQLFKTEY